LNTVEGGVVADAMRRLSRVCGGVKPEFKGAKRDIVNIFRPLGRGEAIATAAWKGKKGGQIP